MELLVYHTCGNKTMIIVPDELNLCIEFCNWKTRAFVHKSEPLSRVSIVSQKLTCWSFNDFYVDEYIVSRYQIDWTGWKLSVFTRNLL